MQEHQTFVRMDKSLHSDLKEISRRDSIPIWKVIEDSFSLYKENFKEKRVLDFKDRRGRRRSADTDILSADLDVGIDKES